MKVAVIPAGVTRPIPEHADACPAAFWFDCYGLDSARLLARVEAVPETQARCDGARCAGQSLPAAAASIADELHVQPHSWTRSAADRSLSFARAGRRAESAFPISTSAFSRAARAGHATSCTACTNTSRSATRRATDLRPGRIDRKLLEQLCQEYGPGGESNVVPNPEGGVTIDRAAARSRRVRRKPARRRQRSGGHVRPALLFRLRSGRQQHLPRDGCES